MGYRDFTDATGVRWQAWDVVPKLVERRQAARRSGPATTPAAERRIGMDRRIMSTRRPTLGSGMGQGWLCFESGGEKRRLVPIPADWMRCREATLADYCRQASPVRRESGAFPVPTLVTAAQTELEAQA